ncbi:MAG: ABC transporter permease [archaeon GB-1867-035]|nr:ABC transporter permease [Candidatus Culexmicrobium profundum]
MCREFGVFLNFLKLSLWRELKRLLYFKVGTIISLVDVIINLVIYYIVAHKVMLNGISYSHFILVGIIVNSILSYALATPYSSVIESYWSGRLEILMLAPINPILAILAMSIARLLRLLLQLIIYTLLSLFFGLNFALTTRNVLLTFLALFLGVSSCIGIGLIGSSMIYHIDARGGREPITWIIELLSGIISGAYFPIDMLPDILQKASWLLPHRYVLDIVRVCILNLNAQSLSIWYQLAILLTYTIISLLLGFLAMLSAIKKAKRTGALSRWV